MDETTFYKKMDLLKKDSVSPVTATKLKKQNVQNIKYSVGKLDRIPEDTIEMKDQTVIKTIVKHGLLYDRYGPKFTLHDDELTLFNLCFLRGDRGC